MKEETEKAASEYLSEEMFFRQFKHLFKGSITDYDTRLNRMAELLETPLVLISSMDAEGLVEIEFSKEILVPSSSDQARYIRILTYEYAIELSIDVDGFVIRGEPYLDDKFKTDTKVVS